MAHITAGDVIDLARDHGIDYDLVFTPDARCFRELNRIVHDLVDQLASAAALGYVLPGDDTQEIDVTSYQEFYPMPAGHWRVRALRLRYSTHPQERPIQRVSPHWAASVPQVFPSAYIEHGGLHPIDGVMDGLVASRRFGWLDAEFVDVFGLLEPVPATALTDVLALPDDGLRTAAYELVAFYGKRGRTADSLRQQTIADAKGAKESLFRAAIGYPGPPSHPTV